MNIPALAPSAVNLLVVHCSATSPTQDVGAEDIKRWHRANGFATIGYHYVIRRSGAVEVGRPETQRGAHAAGFNARSIGICLVGGVDAAGKPSPTFTPEQFASLKTLLADLFLKYPGVKIVGHRDLSPDLDGDGQVEPEEWTKACPSFDVEVWLRTGAVVFSRKSTSKGSSK